MAVLLLASAAWGGVARFTVTPPEVGAVATFSYRAAPGEKNRADVFLDWSRTGSPLERDEPVPSRPPAAFIVGDRVGAAAGPGCRELTGDDAGLVRCPFPPGATVVGPQLRLGDRDDVAVVDVVGPGVRVVGGAGNDRISATGAVDGGPGNDRLVWGGRVSGGPGRDSIEGSDGRDVIDGGPGDDTIVGRPGFELLGSSRGRALSTRVPRDELAGGDGDDTVAGRGTVSGGAGNDRISGIGRLRGGRGNDTVEGRGVIYGGAGRDAITGSAGRDAIFPGPDEDTVVAERGNDRVRARDGSIDSIECWGGRDAALVDGLDHVDADCERLTRRGAARAVPSFASVDEEERTFTVAIDCPRDGPALCEAHVEFALPDGIRRSRTLHIARGRFRFIDVRVRPRVVSLFDSGTRTVRVTVRSTDRAGRPQVASGLLTVDFEEDETKDCCD